jgi:biotin operon repressor
MSVKCMAAAWDQQDLTDGEKLTLMALADHADDYGRCWPSNGRIGEKLGLKDRAVRERVKRLEDKGVLTRVKRERENGSQTTNLITLHLPGIPDPPGTDMPGTPGSRDAAPEPPEGRAGVSSPNGNQGEEQQTLEQIGTPVEAVFKAWKKLYGGDRAKLTEKRRSRINARLEDGRTVEELIEALEGAQHDDWLMGRRDGSPGYEGIDTLLRDDDQVLRLIALGKHGGRKRRPKRFEGERDPGSIPSDPKTGW